MNIDVHSHVIPRQVIEFVTSHDVYGVKAGGGRWQGPGHAPFALGEEWYEPEAMIAEMRGW